MTLVLINCLQNKAYTIPVEDTEESRLYYVFQDLALETDMPDGIYNYELYDDDDDLLTTGLMQIGEFEDNNTQYDDNNTNNRIIYDN